MTLASIVEKEAAQPDERPIIAAVYQNRLRIGMGLQCDPTVIYALEKAGRYTGNLTKADLQLDSPYNTYRYAGLPPGSHRLARPRIARGRGAARRQWTICTSSAATTAATSFATTLAEHNRNVKQWQVDFFKEKSSPVSNGSCGSVDL